MTENNKPLGRLRQDNLKLKVPLNYRIFKASLEILMRLCINTEIKKGGGKIF